MLLDPTHSWPTANSHMNGYSESKMSIDHVLLWALITCDPLRKLQHQDIRENNKLPL